MKSSLVFVGAKRTPFGSFTGSLASLTATDLAVHASRAALSASNVPASAVEHVLFGNVLQTSADAAYLARHVGLRSGVAEAVPAVTVNRLCGSGFEAIIQGASLLRNEDATTVLVGGTENMSQAPYVLRGARTGYRMGNADFEDSLTSGLTDAYVKLPMAITAENLAERYSISRSACDEYALLSQQRACAATEAGRFDEEIAPVTVTVKKEEKKISRDEHLRFDASLEALGRLKPVFKKDGVVTAGNASGMVDGACALVLTTRERAESHRWPILGEFVGHFVVGCDPKVMGIGPVAAIRGLLSKTQMDLKDISLFEVNEAFAAQYLAVEEELDLPRERTNINGGAISVGHPLGASGARIAAHLLFALRERGGGLGIGSACIGGGQGIAVLIRV